MSLKSFTLKSMLFCFVIAAVATCTLVRNVELHQQRMLIEHCLANDGTGLRDLGDTKNTTRDGEQNGSKTANAPTMLDAARDMLDFDGRSR